MAAFSLRPYSPDDHAAVTALYHASRPLGTSPPENESGYKHRYVAVNDVTNQIAGYGEGGDGDPSGLRVMVSPEWQRQGVGLALWSRLQDSLSRDNVASVETWVREENTVGCAWLTALGFVPIHLDGPVRLILPQADMAPFAFLPQSLATQGITITTLADEKTDDPDCLPKLYALYTTIEADIPGNDAYTPPPHASFIEDWGKPEKLLFLAKDGMKYVGLSTGEPRDANPFLEERHDIFQQQFTAVLREYRQRGIATALKLQIIAHAKDAGYDSLWTHSDNPAMRALNKKLGFQSGPWRIYHKALKG